MWTGLLSDPGPDGCDGPLATLSCARDRVRKSRREGRTGPVTILLRGGVYILDEPLVLDPEDGGSTWAAYPGESPCLEAGRRILAWERFEGLLPGLPEKAKGHIWSADVEPGWRFRRLFWDDQELPRSANVAEDDWRSWPICQLGGKPDEEVVVPHDLLPPEGDGEEADLNFLPTPYTRWSNAITPVRAVRRDDCVIGFLFLRMPRPDKTRDVPFRLENLAAGLTKPGRWYLDGRRGRLYLWPPDSAAPGEHQVMAPYLTEVVRLQGDLDSGLPVRGIVLRGLTLQNARESRPDRSVQFDSPSAAINLNAAEDCSLERLIFKNMEGWAVRGGPILRRVSVRHCEISDGGAGGIQFTGKISASQFGCEDNRIEDNSVHRCGRNHWHSAGISVAATARTRIAHNLVYDMPYAGITTSGGARHTYFRGWPRPFPDLQALWLEHGKGEPTIDAVKRFIPGFNRIEKNIVHHVMQVLDDGAAIYCHAGHHEEVLDNVVYSVFGGCGMGLYFDDEQMDSRMEGNLVYRCPEREEPGGHGAAIHAHHNGRNRFVCNLLVGGAQLLSFANGYGGHVIERNVLVWSSEPDWNRADPRPVRGPGDGRRQADWDAGPSVVRSNLWWHAKGREEAERLLATWRSRGYDRDSKVADPGFYDPANADYRIKADSPAVDLGFKSFGNDDAGPRPDTA